MSIIHNRGKEVETLTLLCEKFPATFFMYQDRRKPLKIGIRHDIEAILGDTIERKLILRALKIYIVNIGYLKSQRVGAPRIDLDGGGGRVRHPGGGDLRQARHRGAQGRQEGKAARSEARRAFGASRSGAEAAGRVRRVGRGWRMQRPPTSPCRDRDHRLQQG